MDLTALEKELESRTPEEQDRLSTFLTLLRAKRNPIHQRELGRRLDDSDGWLKLNDLKSRLSIERSRA